MHDKTAQLSGLSLVLAATRLVNIIDAYVLGALLRRSLDRPILAVVAGLNHRLVLIETEAVDSFEVEALAAVWIENCTSTSVYPLLCASPVALEYLDKRSVSRSASSHI
jgi:hypothetical protein